MSDDPLLLTVVSALLVLGYAFAVGVCLYHWRRTRDMLFLFLGLTFGLMATAPAVTALTGDPVRAPGGAHLLRIIGFLLATAAVAREWFSDDRRIVPPRRLRVCLAASGGGHLRQLLDLGPAWDSHQAFFVTERTALSESLSATHQVFFVPHVAIGQARLGRPFTMLRAAVINVWRTAKIVFRERPDIVISTGAGSVYSTLLFSRLLGARIIVIETFARFHRPSLFARLASPFADELVVQADALRAFWPRARVFDPLRLLDGPRPDKKPILFATVGATLPFDRLVDQVAALATEGAISHEVVIQTGVGGRVPAGFRVVETLPFGEVQALLREADVVVCHGGTGSIITALREGCHVIAMPRLFERGEHYDNHQAEITEAFAARGLVTVARSLEDLAEAVGALRERRAVMATTDHTDLIQHLKLLLGTEARSHTPSAGVIKVGRPVPSTVPTRETVLADDRRAVADRRR